MTSDVNVSAHDTDADETAAAAPADNPILLGLPCAAIGVFALGLFLLGYAPAGAPGAVVPLFVALGIGLFIAARWAIANGAGPVASIFGLFGAFFFSFAFLFVGFTHNWYGTNPPGANSDAAATALTDTFSVFALCWAIVTTVLVLGTLRLPLSIVMIIVFSDLVFIFVWLSFITGTFADQGILRTLAGVSCFVAGVAGCYVFFASLTPALGARALPLGRAPRS